MQVGVVHGSVHQHVHMPGQSSRPPHEVPFARPFFTDRDEVIDFLDERYGDPGRAGAQAVVLTGPRGVGKSEIARKWANMRADRYPDGQLYVDLGETLSDALTAPDVAASLLRRLGVSDDDIGSALDGRVERFRSAVSGRNVLVVFDHAVTAAQVAPFMTSAADVLVTTRSAAEGLRLEGACIRGVEYLEAPFACNLFRDAAGLHDSDGATDAVIREIVQDFCGGLPLAIRLCAGMYVSRRGERGVAEWFEDLRGSSNPLSRMRVGGRAVLEEIFDEVYRGLSPLEARVYRSVGMLPTGRFAVGDVAAMLGITDSAADDVAFGLVDQCVLVRFDGRFEVHRLIQRHAHGIADLHSADEAVRMRCRVVDYVTARAQAMDRALVDSRLRVAALDDLPETTEFADAQAAQDWYAAERGAALGYARLAKDCGLWAQVCAMSEAWWYPAYAFGEFDLALEVSDIGIEVAEQIREPALSARLLGQSALVCIKTGDLPEASKRLERAYRWLADVDPMRLQLRLAASLKEWSAKLADARGDDDEAEAAFGESRDFFVGLGSRRGIALQYHHLAKLALKRERYYQGADLAAQAIGRLDAGRDTLTLARVAIVRARCLNGLQDTDSARVALAEMGELRDSGLFATVPLLLGQLHECIASAAEILGEDAVVREALAAAQAAFASCGSSRAHDVAQRIAALGQSAD